MTRSVRVIGPGRAGQSIARALGAVGWKVDGILGRDDDVTGAAHGVDLLLIATPDAAVATVATAVEPDPHTVVAHVAGALGLDALAPHPERASMHPLVSLPEPDVGAERLRAGAWFAVAGHALATEAVDALGGRAFPVADRDRAAYHAAAVIASNHLVALFDQVAAVKPPSVPLDAYAHLAIVTLANVVALGPVRALTGPAARGDTATIERHHAALPPGERALYTALSERCREIASR